jgi:UDP-4-amino-4,6-dideoxy-N-acetyl-beta-L-altrosamine N-acetyltransferase
MGNVQHAVRLVTSADLNTILEWRNHPDVRRHMYNTSVISLEEHRNWFEAAQADQSRCLLVYQYEGIPQGYISFSERREDGEIHWGFYMSPYCELKLGYFMGRAALLYGFNTRNYPRVWGEVLVQNIASQKFHERLGFTQVDECERNSVETAELCAIYRYVLDEKKLLSSTNLGN